MNLRFRVSSLLPRRLDELGISSAAVLRQAGLPLGLFQQDKILLLTEEFFALWETIAHVSGNPAVGLQIGSEDRIERYDPVAIAALYTRTFRDALLRMARYKRLTCPEDIQVVERDGECLVHFEWLRANEVEPPSLIDVCFAWVLSVARRGTGRKIAPLRIEFRRPPALREHYEDHFGCRIKYNAPRNALVFRSTDVDSPFLTHNPEMLRLVAPQLEEELRDRDAGQSVVEQTKTVIKRLLAGQRPAIGEVAREMGMSQRTLQRRLTEDESSFQRVVEEARRELARHYLRHSTLELNQTAYLLGYADANSFHRAFHLWEGTSPGQWRRHHQIGASEVVEEIC